MKVAVTAIEPSLDAVIDPRFGRCTCFILVDTEDMEFDVIENPGGACGGGAGIQAARALAHSGANAVLTGRCGPNAHETLTAAGIGVVLGCSGRVGDAVERWRAGELELSLEPSADGHGGVERG